MMPVIIPVGGHISGSGQCRQMTTTEKVVMTPICSGLFIGFLIMFFFFGKAIGDDIDSNIIKFAVYIIGFCLSCLWLVPLILCW